MRKNNFGFNINHDRQHNLDIADRSMFKRIALIEPSLQRCIFCGGCASTCTSSKFTEMSFRLISLNIRRGHIDEVRKMVAKCMLCGKCTMVCPRDVNIRHIIVLLKKELNQHEL